MRTRTPFPSLSLRRGNGATLRSAVYRACLDAIVSGRMPLGTRLPSARQLALDWRVSRNTVDDALASLQADGVLVRRVGAGTFVAQSPPPAAQRPAPSTLARHALVEVSTWSRRTAATHVATAVPRTRAFVAGLPDIDAFPLDLWRRLQSARMRASGRDLLGYAPSEGLPSLRAALARHLAIARGIACQPEQVMIVNSTMHAVDLAARVLLERGVRVWIEDPAFPNLHAVLTMAGVRPAPVAVDEAGLVVADGVARAPRAKLVHVTPSCQYPTGATMSAPRRAALLDWAARHNAWILEDDYQSEFHYDVRPPTPLVALDPIGCVLHLGTFTNAVFPSLRLAWIVLPHALVDTFAAVRAQLDQHSNAMAQAVLADFIEGGHLAAHLRRVRALYARRRDAILRALERQGVERSRLGPVHAGMHLTVTLPPRRSDRAVAARAGELGVVAMPLSRYARRGGWNGLLLGYAALDERAIEHGIARLAPLLR